MPDLTNLSIFDQRTYAEAVIRPRITLEQANLIASWADANSKNPKVGEEKAWPYAIATFKKAYTVRKGKWIKREVKEMQIQEASKSPDDYLVVEDPEKSTTWHLQVKTDGKPDHRLMGASWAALHGGYRGNKYEGPDKDKAIAKLKALYKSEDMEAPAAEMYAGAMPYGSYVPYGITSLAALKAQREASELSEGLNEAVSDFVSILNNITSAPEIPDKIGAMQSLWGEFMAEVEDLLAAPPTEERQPQLADNLVELAESEPLGAIELVEAEAGKPDLLYMDVQVIRPGWGNTRDNNYYPREMLQRDAAKFVGAKMYESDHRDDQKSTKTWVSTIAEIKGFTGEGAPVARVAVHDPDFAQRLRNLKAAGLLEKMECSILASGSARSFELAGRKGKQVEAISEVSSVDWVTRAGAGGKALSLAETEPLQGATNAQGGDPVSDSQATTEPTQPASVETPAQETQAPEPEAEAPVVIHEEQPKVLAAEEVKKLLETSNLPEVSRARLQEESYAGATELTSAIAKEREYVKLLTGSGRPFGMAESAVQKPATLEEVEKAKDAVIKKYLNK